MSIDRDSQLSLLPVSGGHRQERPPRRRPATEISVLTWNVQRANAARTRAQLSWLDTRRPDVLVLSEVSEGSSGALMAKLLEESGYAVHLPSPAQGDRYRVLLACESGVIESMDVIGAGFAHRCVTAQVKLAQGTVGVVGLYVPSRGPKEQRNVAKRAFQDAVAAALPRFGALGSGGPVVITGDLNVLEPDHTPKYPVFGKWEYDFYRSFQRQGFADAFRALHHDRVEHSWFGRPAADDRRNGYRFDHTFISAAHERAIRACHYVHEPREQQLSDHSAMELTFVPWP